MPSSSPSIRRMTLATSMLAAVALVGCGDAGSDFDVSEQIGPNPVLPEPNPPLLANVKVAEVVGWTESTAPTVPDGLVISAYAKDLAHPRTLYTLPNGDVLVVQSRGPTGKPVLRPKDVIRGWIMAMAQGDGGGEKKESNLITLFRDTDRDGTPDQRHDLLTNMSSPFGVVYYENTLYIAATDAILAYPYKLGQTSIDAKPRVVTPLPGGPINHHWTKDLALSPDGRYLFASVGSNSNVAERGLEAEKGRAAIWQVDRETGASRVYASGLRNPNGLSVHPETGTLWTVVNERDELGPNLVPDYMTSVKQGGFYGWPWSYFGNHVDPRVQPTRPDMVEQALVPDYALSSHVAPLGMAFSYRSALPSQYRSGAFVGQHGSWNRTFFNGYKVVYIPFENGMPADKAQDVVTGFLNGEQARGRPVGVAIDGTGALLIADDVGNAVWRVAAADGSKLQEPVGTDPVRVSSGASGGQASGTPGGAPSRMTEQNSQPGSSASTGASAAKPAQTEIAPATLPENAPRGDQQKRPAANQ